MKKKIVKEASMTSHHIQETTHGKHVQLKKEGKGNDLYKNCERNSKEQKQI